ncbi:hypothetical protein ABMA28_001699 [Loxostege sticticalis]|uniref:glutathione transferase n=1 Tax=Loxostege sticticalis TaxID=481309 RepID=A0ABD0T2U8_LOXSC
MSRKLVYFDVNGYTEAVRYILHYSGLKFEDVRIDFNSFGKIKESLPYGQVPIYEENGRKLNQSMAITRYVASQTGLLPSDPWEQAILDAAVLTIYDFIQKLVAFYWCPVNKKEDKEVNKKAMDEATPYFLSRFEKELKAGGGHFGGKLSWADFVFVGVVEMFNLYLDDPIHTGYPAVTALVSEIQGLPGVKEYIANRKPYVRPVAP